MRQTRPTLKALSDLPAEHVPDRVNSVLARVRAACSPEARKSELSRLRLYDLDVPLIRDADRRLADGGLPDVHKSSTKRLGFPVYEVRDAAGAAVRGAVIVHEGDPWLVFVAPHDRFHGVAAETLHNRREAETLFPSELDKFVRNEEEAEQQERREQQELLLALLDALEQMLATGADADLDTTTVRLPVGSIKVAGVRVPDEGWEPTDAHEHAELYAVELSFSGLPYEDHRWALGVIAPFLAPDSASQEVLYDHRSKQATLQVVLTNAELLQLLADRSPRVYEPGDCTAPQPTVLHYADKYAITKAFVHGDVIRAVCGEWFIPRGDDHTFEGLPVCAGCEAEVPAAQAMRDMLRGRV